MKNRRLIQGALCVMMAVAIQPGSAQYDKPMTRDERLARHEERVRKIIEDRKNEREIGDTARQNLLFDLEIPASAETDDKWRLKFLDGMSIVEFAEFRNPESDRKNPYRIIVNRIFNVELELDNQKNFDQFDLDQDGILNSEELNKAYDAATAIRKERRAKAKLANGEQGGTSPVTLDNSGSVTVMDGSGISIYPGPDQRLQIHEKRVGLLIKEREEKWKAEGSPPGGPYPYKSMNQLGLSDLGMPNLSVAYPDININKLTPNEMIQIFDLNADGVFGGDEAVILQEQKRLATVYQTEITQTEISTGQSIVERADDQTTDTENVDPILSPEEKLEHYEQRVRDIVMERKKSRASNPEPQLPPGQQEAHEFDKALMKDGVTIEELQELAEAYKGKFKGRHSPWNYAYIEMLGLNEKTIFEEYDTDSDGLISGDENRQVMRDAMRGRAPQSQPAKVKVEEP